ncbi:MAG: DUF4395 domain-containing protein [Spirochaetia bacterium]|nr:DUF4395 domain-containing protein [Spirochaetia bacterium]
MGEKINENFGLRINETATRARAGFLNMLSATTIVILIFAPELDPVIYVGPFVIYDMLIASLFGLTPLSPMGIIGTFITLKMEPLWKPNKPKRFAWILGASLGVTCLAMRLLNIDNNWIIGVVAICFVLTWLESVLGFCVGCWMHGKLYGCEDCSTAIS